MIEKIISFIFGYCIYSVPSIYAKRLTNGIIEGNLFCKTEGFFEDKYNFRCSLFAMLSIVRFAEKEYIPLNVEKLTGIPFIIYRYRKRHGLLLGTLIGLTVIFLSGSFIWGIRFEGQDADRKLLEQLKAAGFQTGMYIPELDIADTEIQFLLDNDEYSFIAINVKGSIANVELRKRVVSDSEKNPPQYSNLVASDTGIIVSVEALSGFPAVKKGDIVVKGDLLINGAFERRNGSTGLVRSRGKVFAECTDVIRIDVPLYREEAFFSGAYKETTEYSFFGKTITIGGESINEYDYAALTESFKPLYLFNLIRLPVDKYVVTYYEVDFVIKSITYEEASKIAEQSFQAQCDTILGDNERVSINFSTVYNEKTNSAELTGELVYIKDIASEVEFTVD